MATRDQCQQMAQHGVTFLNANNDAGMDQTEAAWDQANCNSVMGADLDQVVLSLKDGLPGMQLPQMISVGGGPNYALLGGIAVGVLLVVGALFYFKG